MLSTPPGNPRPSHPKKIAIEYTRKPPPARVAGRACVEDKSELRQGGDAEDQGDLVALAQRDGRAAGQRGAVDKGAIAAEVHQGGAAAAAAAAAGAGAQAAVQAADASIGDLYKGERRRRRPPPRAAARALGRGAQRRPGPQPLLVRLSPPPQHYALASQGDVRERRPRRRPQPAPAGCLAGAAVGTARSAEVARRQGACRWGAWGLIGLGKRGRFIQRACIYVSRRPKVDPRTPKVGHVDEELCCWGAWTGLPRWLLTGLLRAGCLLVPWRPRTPARLHFFSVLLR